jgi:single-stranded DNA-binding protein
VVSRGELGRHVAARAAEGSAVTVTGRLDSFELPSDNGSHFCQHVIVAASVDVSEVPF